MVGFFLAIGQTLWVSLGLYFWEAKVALPRAGSNFYVNDSKPYLLSSPETPTRSR